MKQSPCYNCPERAPECHADCERYAAWANARAAERAKRRKPIDADAHTKATIARNCKRAQTKRQVGRM